jgi:hypothetical protein
MHGRRGYAREAEALHQEDDESVSLEDEEAALGSPEPGRIRTRAQTVRFDARARRLELSGDVRIDAAPFHLRSRRLLVSRSRLGVEVEGEGRLVLCACPAAPLDVSFDKAMVAPRGELFLRQPKLELFGVPILYAPWMWLRSEEKLAFLPPDLAYRGKDGLFLGEGVHIPWPHSDGLRTIDLRAGAYVMTGGSVVDARMRTPSSSLHVRHDWLPREHVAATEDAVSAHGLVVDARGALASRASRSAWDIDALRGARGVRATTDLDTAARPWDRAALSTAFGAHAITTEAGIRALSRRGGRLDEVDAAGPFAALRSSGAFAEAVSYDLTFEGGALRLSSLSDQLARGPISYGRAEGGILAQASAGAVLASLSLRTAAQLAHEPIGTASNRSSSMRAHVGLPLARGFGEAAEGTEDDARLVHAMEPFAEVAVVDTQGSPALGLFPGRGMAVVSDSVPLAEAGLRTTLGRWASREALELLLAAGAAESGGERHALLRSRVASSFDWLGFGAESAHAVDEADRSMRSAFIARARLGRLRGVRVFSNVAFRRGLDPSLARALFDPAIEAPSGFLRRPGTVAGAGLAVPIGAFMTASASSDVDVDATALVGARAGLELHDRCGCMTLRTTASQRLGREGIDAWISLELQGRP